MQNRTVCAEKHHLLKQGIYAYKTIFLLLMNLQYVCERVNLIECLVYEFQTNHCLYILTKLVGINSILRFICSILFSSLQFWNLFMWNHICFKLSHFPLLIISFFLHSWFLFQSGESENQWLEHCGGMKQIPYIRRNVGGGR